MKGDPRTYICPACPHPVADHRAKAPRTLFCRDCPCSMTTKWRYAWAVTLLALLERWQGRG